MRTRPADRSAPEGLLVVDKPAGWTSHDVVARLRGILGTRRVGHAGTLDPMATGVLVVGVGRGTRLLRFLSAAGKTYEATIRLGQATTTDDADGHITAAVDAQDVGLSALREVVESYVGTLAQVPPAVSAVKVAGRRSYSRVRAGEDVELPARLVTIHQLELRAVRAQTVPTLSGEAMGQQTVVDVDVVVDCSSGTYIRALARDVGERLGVGGHLTALRRTRVGPFQLAEAHPLRELADTPPATTMLPLAVAAARVFPVRLLTHEETVHVGHGRPIPAHGEEGQGLPAAGLSPNGRLVALLVAGSSGQLRPSVVFAPATHPDVADSDGDADGADDGDNSDAADGANSRRGGIPATEGVPDEPAR